MSFVFRATDRSVQSGFRRIARAELRDALHRLDGALPDAAAVHGLRKHSKKLRGLIRLVRPVFPGFAAANARLRDGAARLAPLRDAEVRLATLKALAPHLPEAGTAALPALSARLEAEVAALRAGADLPAELAKLAEDLTELRAMAAGWRLTAQDWDALAPGLRATWRAARHGRRAAAAAVGGDATAFHEWRKAVKHHWYHARLLEPLWPAYLGPWIAQVDALGEGLGRHNDLDVLRTHIAALDDPALAALAHEGPIAEALAARMRAEAAAALGLGARLLADRPAALARRWGVWWRVWKAGA